MKNDPILSAAFAGSDERDQAGFINELARELFVVCKGRNGFEQQICGLSKHLDADGISFIEQLMGFIELRRKPIE